MAFSLGKYLDIIIAISDSFFVLGNFFTQKETPKFMI